MFSPGTTLPEQPALLATVLAQQTLADSINKAWSVASPELKEAFARSVFVWCVSYLNTAPDTLRLPVAHQLVSVISKNATEMVSEELKAKLAEAVVNKLIWMFSSKQNMLSWEEQKALKLAIQYAVQNELAAAGRELSVSAIGGSSQTSE